MLTLTCLGGAGTVTGSKHLLRHGDTRLLIDCGLFQGYKNLRQLNWQPLSVSPRDIDAVILTHAHLDHSGHLPRLVRDGYRHRIFASEATRALARLILLDSARVQEKDAEYANLKGFSRHAPALPLYAVADVQRALERFVRVPLYQAVPLPGEAQLVLRRAGHIPGACSVQIDIGGRRIVFSGDLGPFGDPLMPAPDPVPAADIVVIESTYGNRRHVGEDPAEALAGIIARTAARGGSVVIPAFAVGRTQLLIHLLWQLRQQGRLHGMPVYLDSPMASSANELMHAYPGEHRLDPEDYRAACNAVICVDDATESLRLSADGVPKIIVSSSGMATGGRVLHHIAALAPDPRNTLLFTGYQAGGTRGRRLLDGERETKIHGQWIPVKAEVAQLPMLSAHADGDELLHWLSGFQKKPDHVLVVHGEPDAADALRQRIGRELGIVATVPLQDQEIAL